VGVGWAVQEFDALGVPFGQRGELADDYLRVVRTAWADEQDYRGGRIPIWVGGNSDAGLRRAVRLGEAWHPLRFTMPWLQKAVDRMTAFADEQERPVPALAPRIALRLAGSPVTGPRRLAGEGTIDQVLDDLAELSRLAADTVVLDTFNGDPGETRCPEAAWQALATVSAATRHLGE
jgi:alkanesulfonate monooxygenase SsuD/methylene tetrahydromethanopterin reductase-like flavin-dependent oxidoreductase (luciferase family)